MKSPWRFILLTGTAYTLTRAVGNYLLVVRHRLLVEVVRKAGREGVQMVELEYAKRGIRLPGSKKSRFTDQT